MFEQSKALRDFSKSPENDPRIGDLVNDGSKSEASYALYGYPDDRGVENNGGRVGAALGPDAIRKYLFKSTVSYKQTSALSLSDLGNLKLSDSIANDHQSAIDYLKTINPKTKLISFGGGHDYAYPDGKVFLSQEHHTKPVIVNFDAHLDCRPYEDKVNSGTPFYRLLKEHPGEFHFFEIGLQEQCNNKEHLKWAESRGLKVLWLEEILLSNKSFDQIALDFFGASLYSSTKAFITVDMDAFSSSLAPGCSQSWPTGIDAPFFFKCFHLMMTKWNVTQLGIYETCPRLDVDGRTSRLASKIAHFYLSN